MNAIHAARELLIKQNITSFKSEPRTMKHDMKIVFYTFEEYAKITGYTVERKHFPDGFTMIRHGMYTVLTHEVPSMSLHRSTSSSGAGKSRNSEVLRQRWTLAHEVGHVYLGHAFNGQAQEREANTFAGELLLPELVLLELRRQLRRELSVGEVARLFGVSQSAAECRLRQIGRRSAFSPYLKEELMAKYERLIAEYTDMVGTPMVSALIQNAERNRASW